MLLSDDQVGNKSMHKRARERFTYSVKEELADLTAALVSGKEARRI